MRELKLTRGFVAILDSEDYDKLSEFRWSSLVVKSRVYGVRGKRIGSRSEGKQEFFYLHRVIMSLYGTIPEGHMVDHINGNTLDNRKENLRIATDKQNVYNTRKRSGTTSRFKGVCWNKQRSKWQVEITLDGKRIGLGRFTDELEAAQAYNEAAARLFGEFARLNDLTLGYSIT